MPRLLVVLTALGILLASPVAAAQKDSGAPKPDTYLCPTAMGGKAVDCFLEAVSHLYTMCRQVKSIEIIEFGYEKSDEGVNGAKSEYCVDKHKVSMTRPYQAALREAGGSKDAIDGLRGLYDHWLKALADLKWKPGETDRQYQDRVARPYGDFTEHAAAIHVAMEQATAKAKPATAAAPKPAAAKPKPKAAAAAPKSTN